MKILHWIGVQLLTEMSPKGSVKAKEVSHTGSWQREGKGVLGRPCRRTQKAAHPTVHQGHCTCAMGRGGQSRGLLERRFQRWGVGAGGPGMSG